MPIYEYQCQECGAISEYLLPVGGGDLVLCKSCGSSQVEKVISASSVLSKIPHRAPGKTCCGREERCSTPPCSTAESCCKS